MTVVGHIPRGVPRYFAREVKPLLAYAKDPNLALAVGINLTEVDDPEATLPLPTYYDLLERAAAATADPNFGFHFALHWRDASRQNRGALSLLMLSSPNLRTLCERLIRYQSYWNAGEAYQVEERDQRFSIRYGSWGPQREAHIHMAEKTVATIVMIARGVDPADRPLALRFAHRSNGNTTEIATVLGLTPTYAAATTEVVLPAALMDKPLPTQNFDVFRLSDQYLAKAVGEASTTHHGYTELVRRAVHRALLEGNCSQEVVARAIGHNQRTLQRRLAAENTSIRKLIDSVRKDRAVELLGSSLSIGEVSYLLGYSEPAAFQHAFRRWYGVSAKAWRHRNVTAAAGNNPHASPAANNLTAA